MKIVSAKLEKINFTNFSVISNLCEVRTVWKKHKISLTKKEFREINFSLVKTLLSRNLFYNSNSRKFHKIFQIRAAVPIRKGEHISIMYSDPMWGTGNRHQHLYETKYFHCKCSRCLDPTEMGTEFSSLKCPSCTIDRNGYLAPIGNNLWTI